MTGNSGKIQPPVTPDTAFYWQGCCQHELRLQYCAQCDAYQFYPRTMCSNCLGEQLQWVVAVGAGIVRSYTVVRRPVSEAYRADVPYVVALVQLREGPTMMTNIVQCDPPQVFVGQAVEVVFDDGGEVSLPMFRPSGEGD